MSEPEPNPPAETRKNAARPARGLDSEAFESLLRLLDPDRQRAGFRYEELRKRLTMFFEHRRHPDADDLVDAVMDRVACRLRDGKDIPAADAAPFIFGVARMIALEEHRRRLNRKIMPLTWDVEDERQQPSQRELECLDRCLEALEAETRRTILSYYLDRGRKKLDNRSVLAARLGITATALASRTWRIRKRLEDCVGRCVGRDS